MKSLDVVGTLKFHNWENCLDRIIMCHSPMATLLALSSPLEV